MKRLNGCFAALIFVFLVSCQNGGNTITGPSPITPGNTGNTEVKDSALYQYNASFFGGRTARWDKNTITVRDGIGLVEISQFLQEWNQYLNGRRLVLTDADADIEINYGNRGAITNWYTNGYEYYKVKVEMPDVPKTDNFKNALRHEIGHAVSFPGHTSDGGLMDLGTGTGNITSTVVAVVTKLYQLPPGTKVVPE